MKTNYKKLIIFLGILIGGFLIAILALSWPILTGKTYILNTIPVDPFDILRGQYIIIGYEISTVELGSLNTNEFDNIYVIIQKDDEGIYRFKSVSLEKPINENFLRGRIDRLNGKTAQIEYGIEQYYFERGAEFSTTDMQVEIKVDDSGQARITRLLHEGKPLEMTYRK